MKCRAKCFSVFLFPLSFFLLAAPLSLLVRATSFRRFDRGKGKEVDDSLEREFLKEGRTAAPAN